MNSEPADREAYYRATSGRLLPYLQERPVAVVIGSDHSLVQRRKGALIRIGSAPGITALVEGGAIAFLAAPISWEGEVWFSVRLWNPDDPFEVTRLTALKLYLVLGDLGIDTLMYYDGAGDESRNGWPEPPSGSGSVAGSDTKER